MDENRATARSLGRGGIAVAGLALLLLCVHLGALPLIGFSEGRYASIAAEMWRSGDWVTPRYCGIKHLEKPPLAYWGAAAAYEWLGHSETSARLPSALAALLVVALTGWLAARRCGREVGLLAALVVLTFPMTLAMGRVLFTDMLLAAGALLYVVACLEGARPQARRPWAWALLGGLGLGLAMLSKLHVVLLVGTLPLLVEASWTRSRRLAWMTLHPLAWLVGIALLLPWALAMLRDNPGIATWVVENQTRDRILTEVHDRGAPPWFYLQWLPLVTFPWILLVPALWQRRRAATGEAPSSDALPGISQRFLWLWFLLPFVVFSAMGSKRFNYWPPLMPPLALLLATTLAGNGGGAWRRWVCWTPLMLLALAGVGLGITGVEAGDTARVWRGAATGAAFFLAAEWLKRRGRRGRGGALDFGYAYAAALAVAVVLILPWVAQQDLNSHAPAARAAQPFAARGVPVAMYYLEASAVPFYLEGRPPLLIGVERKTQFEEPEVLAARFFADDSDAEQARTDRLLAEAGELILITKKRERLEHLQARVDVSLEVLHEGRYLVVRLKR